MKTDSPVNLQEIFDFVSNHWPLDEENYPALSIMPDAQWR